MQGRNYPIKKYYHNEGLGYNAGLYAENLINLKNGLRSYSKSLTYGHRF